VIVGSALVSVVVVAADIESGAGALRTLTADLAEGVRRA
jgi:hypothetical protein